MAPRTSRNRSNARHASLARGLEPPPFRSADDIARLSDDEILRLGDSYYIQLLERRRMEEQVKNGRDQGSSTAYYGASGAYPVPIWPGQATSTSAPLATPATYQNNMDTSHGLSQVPVWPGQAPSASAPLGTSPMYQHNVDTWPGLSLPPTGSLPSSSSVTTLYEPDVPGNSFVPAKLPPLSFEPLSVTPYDKGKPKDCRSCTKRGCCCFCLYTPTAKWVCAAATIMVLVGIALAIYFCWPRFPTASDVHVGSVQLVPGTDAFVFKKPLERQQTEPNPSISADLTVPITVYSPMKIPISLSFLAINLSYTPPGASHAYRVASGTYPNPWFAGSSNTTLMFPLHVAYTSTEGLADPVIQGLVEQCGFNADSGPTGVSMDYMAVAALAGAFSNIKPSFGGNVQVDVCPILASALIGVIQGLFSRLPMSIRSFVPAPNPAADPGDQLRTYIRLLMQAAGTLGLSTEGTLLQVTARLLQWAGVNLSTIAQGLS